MTVIANKVSRLLFSNVQSLADLSREQLQSLADQYPYFSPLHFLLAAKENDAATDTAVYNKALLHIPHAIQLHYLLHGGGEAVITPAITTSPLPAATAIATEADITTPENEPEEQLPETVVTTGTTDMVTPVPEETKVVEPQAIPVITLTDSFTEEEEEPLPEDETADDGHEIVIPGLKIEAIDPKTAELNLTPTPFHTVDYFASMGIKAKELDKPLDKFDLQLKSFTQWLKTIKKVPENQLNDAKAEQQVEEMAGRSLKNDKIITETMAEVWARQGNTGKAIEVYQKLSLLDPAKSTYFASRIENLKKSN